MPKQYELRVKEGNERKRTMYTADTLEQVLSFIEAKSGARPARTDGGEK